MKKGFIYWLFSAAKKPLYINDAGIMQEGDATTLLTADSKPSHLKHSPDGWKDVLVKYGRNIKYFGLFREFTVPMKFKVDGANIARNLMWNNGIEAICYIGISKLNKTIWPDKYETWYTGELDFSKFIQKKTDVTVNVMEGGLSKLFKANENTTYEIPVDNDPQAVYIVMDGFPFTNKITYTVIGNQNIGGQTEGVSVHYWLGIAIVTSEGSTQGVLTQDVDFNTTTAFPNDFWFIHSEDKNISVKVEGSFPVHCIHGTSLLIQLKRINDDDFSRNDDWTLHSADHTTGEDFIVSYSQEVDLQPTEKLYIRVSAGTDAGLTDVFTIGEGSNIVTYDVTFKATIIKALPSLRLFQKLIEKFTDGKYTGASSFLANLTDYVITSGQAIRNHEGDSFATTHGSVIKTSISDYFKAFFSRFGVCLGIENDVLIIEKIEYFFKNNIAIILGQVDDVNISVAEDLMFNTVKVGQANQTYDEVNGKDEFNVTQQYTTPHTRVVRELDLISPYRADMYGIELTRLNLYGKDTTDNGADNDTFIINVKKGTNYSYFSGVVTFEGSNIKIPFGFLNIINGATVTITGSLNPGNFTVTNTSYLIVGYTTLTVAEPITSGSENVEITTFSAFYYQLNRPAFDAITGLLHPAKAFNVLLSPKSGLLNNASYLHSILDKQDMNFIKFQSGEKNSELSRTLSGVTITEKADVQIGTLPAKLFLPYYFTFTTSVPLNFMALMRSNPYDKISFDYQGNTYTGYLFDGGIKPATNDKQQWKLLAAADNDMTKLINTI